MRRSDVQYDAKVQAQGQVASFVIGLLLVAGGAPGLLTALGIVDLGGMAAPAWVVAGAGIMFVTFGVVLMLGAASPKHDADGALSKDAPIALRFAQYLAGVIGCGGFALVATWAATQSHFGKAADVVGFISMFTGGGEIEWMLRLGPWAAALMLWMLCFGSAIQGWRRLFGRPGVDKPREIVIDLGPQPELIEQMRAMRSARATSVRTEILRPSGPFGRKQGS
jgi:hypothetical protein